MNTPNVSRKPRLYFETVTNAHTMSFDDGSIHRRNYSWLQYAETRWERSDESVLLIKIGEVVVKLRGNNLGPIYAAIADHSFSQVKAMPAFENEPDKLVDTYVVEIEFMVQPSSIKAKRGSK